MAGQRSRSDTGRTGATDREHPTDAGIALTLHRVTVRDNGFATGRDDFDGIRINEGAAGDVVLTVRQTQVVNNAADGIEIDEKGSGSVFTTVHNSVFNDNGTQPQLPEDLEDGFDIDEAGPGGIEVRLVHVSVSANENQGIDLDEEGSGSVDVRGTDVRAIGNRNEGVKISEVADLEDVALESLPSGSGAVVFDFHQLTVRDTRRSADRRVRRWNAPRPAGQLEQHRQQRR